MKHVASSSWPTIYVMVGIPGSGKSTWAREQCASRKAVIVNRDAIRSMLTGNSQKMVGDSTFEELVTRIEDDAVYNAINSEKNVILDATNTRVKATVRRMDSLAASALRYNGPFPKIVPVVMDTPFDECLARNAQREHPVPEQVLHSMHSRLVKELSK